MWSDSCQAAALADHFKRARRADNTRAQANTSPLHPSAPSPSSRGSCSASSSSPRPGMNPHYGSLNHSRTSSSSAYPDSIAPSATTSAHANTTAPSSVTAKKRSRSTAGSVSGPAGAQGESPSDGGSEAGGQGGGGTDDKGKPRKKRLGLSCSECRRRKISCEQLSTTWVTSVDVAGLTCLCWATRAQAIASSRAARASVGRSPIRAHGRTTQTRGAPRSSSPFVPLKKDT